MTSDLVKVEEGIVELGDRPEKILEHFKQFQNLKTKLLDKEHDIVTIQNKPFITKSGWRKVALAFNISDRILREEKIIEGSKTTWKIVVEVKAPNGRTAEGVGICSSSERTFAHPDHDIYATAHTRSKNRAISDLVGAGEVSYEELDSHDMQHNTQSSSNDVYCSCSIPQFDAKHTCTFCHKIDRKYVEEQKKRLQ